MKCIWAFILFIWQLPQALLGLILMLILSPCSEVASRHYNKCYSSKKMRGGISLGPFSFVREGSSKERIAHEVDGHTVDSKYLGPLYLLVIGLPSLLWNYFHERFNSCYYDFYTERLANKHARLEVRNCKLHFIY